MTVPAERSAAGMEAVVEKYGDMLFRISLVTLGNNADAEDAVQDVLIKYMQKAPIFTSTEHEKAWLIRVCINQCRDILRLRHPHVDLDSIREFVYDPEDFHSTRLMEALLSVPDKFRTVLILHYVEGYSVKEISTMLGKKESAIKMRLAKGRSLLENAYLDT